MLKLKLYVVIGILISCLGALIYLNPGTQDKKVNEDFTIAGRDENNRIWSLKFIRGQFLFIVKIDGVEEQIEGSYKKHSDGYFIYPKKTGNYFFPCKPLVVKNRLVGYSLKIERLDDVYSYYVFDCSDINGYNIIIKGQKTEGK